MAEQIYPLTFEGRESNPRMLGGSGVLNTPLDGWYLKQIDTTFVLGTQRHQIVIKISIGFEC